MGDGIGRDTVPLQLEQPKGGSNPNKVDNWILFNVDTAKGKCSVVDVNVPEGSYRTIGELINTIDETVNQWKPTDIKLKLKDHFKIAYMPILKRVRIKLNTTTIKGMVLGTTLQYMLGFGGEWSRSFTKAVHIADYPPDLTGGFNTLFVYCNLLQPQIVGNSLVPLLRTVPITGSYGYSVDKVFLAPHYIPLRNKSFDTIETSIKDDTNCPVKFNFGKSIVKVHLRHKP